jgi:hypothetical protein
MATLYYPRGRKVLRRSDLAYPGLELLRGEMALDFLRDLAIYLLDLRYLHRTFVAGSFTKVERKDGGNEGLNRNY